MDRLSYAFSPVVSKTLHGRGGVSYDDATPERDREENAEAKHEVVVLGRDRIVTWGWVEVLRCRVM